MLETLLAVLLILAVLSIAAAAGYLVYRLAQRPG
ncbi:hypothetical protein BH20ACT5_BH20ACT5_16610 [soil metagenome]